MRGKGSSNHTSNVGARLMRSRMFLEDEEINVSTEPEDYGGQTRSIRSNLGKQEQPCNTCVLCSDGNEIWKDERNTE
ncbi:hypothetical protein GJ744_001227 [Endocarpon pusillum]|uniref:Uncharacterized protein n=1 Tax=Endocarpon pusillum TaxID=364733 RepID=A0A8H7ADL8_9EURO|nr:hypothetical protein GJ744_001227 [Endocarpon pusillum]